jgi:hypothetical protein
MWEPVWFVQFYYDPLENLLLVGNDNGEIYCWKSKPGMVVGFEYVFKFETISKKVLRKVMVVDNNYLIAVSDDCIIWFHKFTPNEKILLGLPI